MRKKMTVGERFGRLTTIRPDAPSESGRSRWLCSCDCGSQKSISTSALRTGDTLSCGCFLKERIRETKTKHGGAGPHGSKKSPEYQTWLGIKKRCYNTSSISYPDYGGRGIKVCDRWVNDFAAFLADMGRRPSDRNSIDRLDVDRDYAPDNCVWATDLQQQNNRRNNQTIQFRGETLTIAQAARRSAVSVATLRARILKLGWDAETAMTLPASPLSQRNASRSLPEHKQLPPRRLPHG